MHAIAASSLNLLRQFGGRPQEISNLAWAVAVLDFRHKTLLEALAAAALRTQVQSFTSQELANTLWAFAGMKYKDTPLLDALASQSLTRMSQVSSQNLVNTAWAMDVLKWSNLDRDAVRAILGRFTSCCGRSLGVEFVTIASLAKEHGILDESPGFLAEFRARTLDPVVSGLRAIRHANDERSLAAEMKRFQDWVLETQTPHLGDAFTVDALAAAGTKIDSPDRSWKDKAREALGRVAWWSCPHAAVSSHGVVAWVLADLQVGDQCVEQAGRVYFADDSAEHSILVERMLQPIFLQVPRNGHAERRALIDLLRAVAHAFKYHNSEAWSEVRGTVQLYASHFPCISCLACIAQFSRRLCCASLQVEFDNAWSVWSEAPVPTGTSDVLIMGSAA